MSFSTLHYIYDPLCGWCYAASQLVEAVQRAGINIKLHGGGLWDQMTQPDLETRANIKRNDQHIATLTGVKFGTSYLHRLRNDDDFIFWSRPTIAAIFAAGEIAKGADLMMLHAIQVAHYQIGLDVLDFKLLEKLAEQIGVDKYKFSALIHKNIVDLHVEKTRLLMQQFELRGFPGFLFESDGRYLRVPHEKFYSDPTGFLLRINSLIDSPW